MYKVLIVEDEDMIRKGLKFMVDWVKLNCVVIGEAANGEEGVQKITELDPDIILLDINMPVKNGLDLLEETVTEFLFSTIVISGYDEFDYAQRAIAYGVEEYLLKPVESDKLYQAIERAKESVELKRRYELIQDELVTPDDIQVFSWDLWNQNSGQSPHMSQAITYIKNHYDEKITMTDLVEETEMSATYLNNHFRESTNYTFNEFLNRYRIQKAIEMIKNTDDKISTIALDVGFSSYRYFIKVFKRYTNTIPSDFSHYYRQTPTESDEEDNE